MFDIRAPALASLSRQARVSAVISTYLQIPLQEVDVGLAADIGTLSRLPKITGNESLLRELAFTAREFGPAEATQLGMVSRVVQGGRDEVLGRSTLFSIFVVYLKVVQAPH
jgi:enoyl-CoA hydratase/carnithine racemase